MKAGGVLAALSLCACAPPAPPPPIPRLDCTATFEALKATVLGQTLVPAPKDPAQPYRFYSTPNGKVSYLITEPDAPAHPAVLMQRVAGADVITTGCGFGDRAAYDEVMAYLEGLKTWVRK